jgi:hypothetical protein
VVTTHGLYHYVLSFSLLVSTLSATAVFSAVTSYTRRPTAFVLFCHSYTYSLYPHTKSPSHSISWETHIAITMRAHSILLSAALLCLGSEALHIKPRSAAPKVVSFDIQRRTNVGNPVARDRLRRRATGVSVDLANEVCLQPLIRWMSC